MDLRPDIESSTFSGTVKINLTWKAEAKVVELHAHYELEIDEPSVKIKLLDDTLTYVILVHVIFK